MYRTNDLPEQILAHDRDLPRRDQSADVPGAEGSHTLAVMVAWYLIAMFAIVLLGHLAAPVPPETSAVAIGGTVNK
jgi:hypothetical protein